MSNAFECDGREVKAPTPGTVLSAFLDEYYPEKLVNEGCGQGHCGACTVLVDGNLRLSCLSLTDALGGSSVMTASYMKDMDPRVADLAHVLYNYAGQCGFCIPAFTLVAYCSLESDKPLDYWLEGQICRCTGYMQIWQVIRGWLEQQKEGAVTCEGDSGG